MPELAALSVDLLSLSVDLGFVYRAAGVQTYRLDHTASTPARFKTSNGRVSCRVVE